MPEAFFTAATGAPGPAGPYTFLHVSNLVPDKRAEETIDAFAREASGVGTRLVIAGGTAQRAEELRAHAEERGVADRVATAPGRVDRERLPDLMADAHCLVLASAVEAGGTVIGEARAAGLAVIATDTWAGRAWVDPDSGAVVPVDDIAALSAAMEDMARDGRSAGSEDRERVRARAREIFSTGAFAASGGRHTN